MARLRLEPPWETYYKELSILLGQDPEIQILYDSYEQEIKIYSENVRKTDALSVLLPDEKEFGNVKVTITIVPANNKETRPTKYSPDLFADLFDENQCVADVVQTTGIYEATYVVFRKEVVQYHNDDIGDVNGNCSTLYQDVAKRIFDIHPCVHFCTARSIALPFVPDHPKCYYE